MKKILRIVTTIVLALIFTVSVKAWAIATFDSQGKEHSMTGYINGAFTQYIQGLHKYSYNAMTIKMQSYKPGAFGIGWSTIGAVKNCNFKAGVGVAMDNCTNTINNSGNTNIKSTWTQTTQGNMNADIGR